MGKINLIIQWIIGLSWAAFACGMVFLVVMMTWFPEWEMIYETRQTVKRHTELSKKLGRTATMAEYKMSLTNIDISTSPKFIESMFWFTKK